MPAMPPAFLGEGVSLGRNSGLRRGKGGGCLGLLRLERG